MSTSPSNHAGITPTAGTGPSPRATTGQPGPHWSQPTNQVPAQAPSLDLYHQKLEQLAGLDLPRQTMLNAFVELACKLTSGIWCGHFEQDDPQPITCVAEFNAIARQQVSVLRSSLLPTAESVLREMQTKITQTGQLTVIAVPIFSLGVHASSSQRECLTVALNLANKRVEPFVLSLQMVASYVARWYERDRAAQLDWQVQATAAVAELMSEMARADKPDQAAILATNHLAKFLDARVVGIGFCRQPGSKRTKIVSVSGTTELDTGGQSALEIEAALNETLIRNTISTLPTIGDDDHCLKLAHRKLLERHPGSCFVSAPLTTNTGKTIGAWICVLPASRVSPASQSTQEKIVQFAAAAGSYLADGLEITQRAAAGPIKRLRTEVGRCIGGRNGLVLKLAVILVGLLMLIPIPHRIGCQATLQPTERRFAVAPMDGILAESFVQPGDLVTAGQVIAQMDDRELQLELADLIAQRETAVKKRDVNRSARDAAATQIAEFEIRQLNAQIRLGEYRQQHLEIKSAVEGIVLQGDLEDARGAPVRTGDVLMEIAPLEMLKLEINVAERDVGLIKPGQAVQVVLDGNPFDAITGKIDLVRPLSEVRDNQNVFVAEVMLSNDDRQLRPGMRGRTKINEGWRPIGWVLFHRPCEKLFSIIR